MYIPFIKMQGLGNDFVVVDARKHTIPSGKDFIAKISDRRWGVGCDQFIVLDESTKADIFMNIYNYDGSVSGACGNAIRCVASLFNDGNCVIETLSGLLSCFRQGDDISVNMGQPKTNWNEIPLSSETDTTNVEILGYNGYCVNMGNPHIVIYVDDAEKIDVAKIGSEIEKNPIFPERINVEFISKTHDGVRMRVWERGGIITQACGSGACAVFVACNAKGICDNELLVHLDGGDLHISYNEKGEVLMCGAYKKSFVGEFLYD